jgi:hypothetical protein
MELLRGGNNRADKEVHHLNLKMGPTATPKNTNPMGGAGATGTDDTVDESKFDLCLVFPINPDTADLFDEGEHYSCDNET